MFGENFKPHPTIQVHPNRFYKRHKKILDDLYKNKKISEREGLSIYSWKHTGVTRFVKVLNLVDVQAQANHETPEQTMEYSHEAKVNEGYLSLPFDLAPTDPKKGKIDL